MRRILGLLVCIVGLWGCQGSSEDVATEGAGAQPMPESGEEAPVTRAPSTLAVPGTDVKLRLLDRTLSIVEQKFYDPKRVHPQKMMAYALDALQSRLAEVVADFDAPLEKDPKSVVVRVNTAQKRIDLTEASTMDGLRITSTVAMDFILKNLSEEVEAKDLEYTLINGMLDTLDPHSVMLTPEIYEDMQTSHGGFGGLGIVIGIRGDDELTVISPIEGTPASRAGLKSEDTIIRIGEESTVNMSLNEAVDKLRGEVGTEVEILVMRKGWSTPRKFVITREHIKIRSLLHHPIEEDGIGYLKIKSFEKNTGDDVRAKLEEMRKAMGGEMKGLILDLRYNAGGLLSQAIKVADTFIDDGVLVVSEEVGGKGREVEKAITAGTEPNYPIVVIVNPGSASASEIVAGALKNHNRALIIGDTTFGKGSVQILKKLRDGSALKLTVAQYLTPGDISIQGVGIAPDIRVLPVYASKEGIDMFVSQNIRREGNLELALLSEHETANDRPSALIKYLLDEEELASGRNDEKFSEDFEIRLARELLKATEVSEREAFLESTLATLGRVGDEEMEQIAKQLATLDVDWTLAGQHPPQPIDVKLEVLPEGPIEAGTEIKIRASVTNRGDQPISRLYAVSSSNNRLLDDREFVFGRIEPGQDRFWELSVSVPLGVETRQDAMTLHFGDRRGLLEDKDASVDVAFASVDPPHFAFTYQLIEKTGNGDGIAHVNEDVNLRVWVENIGKGRAGEPVVYIKNESGSAMYLERGRQTLDPIEPGAMAFTDLVFTVKGTKKDKKTLDFSLQVYDKEFGARLYEEVKLPVFEQPSKLKKAKGQARILQDSTLFGGATSDSQPIAHGPAGALVERVALSADGSMAQIQLDKDNTAWIPTGHLEDSREKPNKDTPTVAIRTVKAAPMVAFDDFEILQSNSEVELTGTIQDDGKVGDYFVYLYQRDGRLTHSLKLDYGIGGMARKSFRIKVPLREGMNRVTVVARDEDKLESSSKAYITRR